MKQLTLEWLTKADADFESAEHELRNRTNPNYDDICFHSQQCLEKILKGFLQEKGVHFPRTHDLGALLDLTLEYEPLWESFRGELSDLSGYATEFRYPGESADSAIAKEAFEICRKIRSLFLEGFERLN